MPLTPRATMFSIAVTWLWLSPSNLPAALTSVAPSCLAAACADCFIFTKNGFVSVLVIRPTCTFPPDDPPPLLVPLLLLLPQAATPNAAAAVTAVTAASRVLRVPLISISPPRFVPSHHGSDNVFRL